MCEDADVYIIHSNHPLEKLTVFTSLLICWPLCVEAIMAKNTGNGFRRGSVTGRTQFQRPDGQLQKRDERTGQLMEVKGGGTPFKGVAKEPDGRDTPNA